MHKPIQPSLSEKSHRRKGAFTRFMRGYLMLVGAGATIYALIRLLVLLLVELQSWMLPPVI